MVHDIGWQSYSGSNTTAAQEIASLRAENARLRELLKQEPIFIGLDPPTPTCPRDRGQPCVRGCFVDYTDFCGVTGRGI